MAMATTAHHDERQGLDEASRTLLCCSGHEAPGTFRPQDGRGDTLLPQEAFTGRL